MIQDLTAHCFYCKYEIDTNEGGWGGSGEEIVWHTECFEMNEGVSI